MWNSDTVADAAARHELIVVSPGHLSRAYLQDSSELWQNYPNLIFHTGYRIAGLAQEVTATLAKAGIDPQTINTVISTAITRDNYYNSSKEFYDDEIRKYLEWKRQFNPVSPQVPLAIPLLPVVSSSANIPSSSFTMPSSSYTIPSSSSSFFTSAMTAPPRSPTFFPSSVPYSTSTPVVSTREHIEAAIRALQNPPSCNSYDYRAYLGWAGPPSPSNPRPGFNVGKIVVIEYILPRSINIAFGYIESMTDKGSIRVRFIPTITTPEPSTRIGYSSSVVKPDINRLMSDGFLDNQPTTIRWSKKGYTLKSETYTNVRVNPYCNEKYTSSYDNFD